MKPIQDIVNFSDYIKVFQNNSTNSLNLCNSFFKSNKLNNDKFYLDNQNTLTNLEILFNEVKDENTLDYIKTLPDGKLYYPEPFIASPSFLHEEI